MSRRSRRARERKGAEGGAAAREGGAAAREGGAAGGPAGAQGRRLAVQLLFLVAVFAVTTGIAELAGAANLGVALGVGQVAFTLAVVYLLVRR